MPDKGDERGAKSMRLKPGGTAEKAARTQEQCHALDTKVSCPLTQKYHARDKKVSSA